MPGNMGRQRFLVAYESIGLDIGESLEGRWPCICEVIAKAQESGRQRRRETGQPCGLLMGIDVIGSSQEEGAKVVAEAFGLLADLLKAKTNHIYVAWNPHDEPRYVRDLLLGQETSFPNVYALRMNGQVESAGVEPRPWYKS
jgi:hypothetical protein